MLVRLHNKQQCERATQCDKRSRVAKCIFLPFSLSEVKSVKTVMEQAQAALNMKKELEGAFQVSQVLRILSGGPLGSGLRIFFYAL